MRQATMESLGTLYTLKLRLDAGKIKWLFNVPTNPDHERAKDFEQCIEELVFVYGGGSEGLFRDSAMMMNGGEPSSPADIPDVVGVYVDTEAWRAVHYTEYSSHP